MKSYYDILEIKKSADANQIKRAYFSLVRRYPPERFPEEFKEIRVAYDTLSDNTKRAEYDEAAAIPQDAARLFQQAQKAKHQGQYELEAKIYEAILKEYPALLIVRAEYGRALIAQGKTGKAATVWETICAMAPKNAGYITELADCYEQRGWRKKAIDAYMSALEIDDSKAERWIPLIHCYTSAYKLDEASAVIFKAIEAVKKGGTENIYLYFLAMTLIAKNNLTLQEGYLKDIVRLARDGVSSQKDIEDTISALMATLNADKRRRYFPYIRALADTLAYMDEALRDNLNKTERDFDIESLNDIGFSNVFHDLLEILAAGCDCDECKLDKVATEYYILNEKKILEPQLLRLKNEFPSLYALHAGFFDEVLNANIRNTKKMLYQRIKSLARSGFQPNLGYYSGESGGGGEGVGGGGSDGGDGSGEGDEGGFSVPQTVRRDTPKIGRNDPCPCGSGKKYKKCCGA